MKLEMFNGVYFFYVIIAVLFFIGSIWFLHNKSDAFKRRYISGILFFALLLHFCKLLFPPYVDDPLAFRKITPENICALSTLVFPFIFFSKNKVLKDYMFYVGVLSGTLAVIYPLEAFGKAPFIFDTIRFYVAHIAITVAPFLMVSTKLHTLDYRRVYKVPLLFMVVLAIIMVNEVILMELGMVPLRNMDLFEGGYRNFSMIFGVNDSMRGLEGFLRFLTPNFMLTIPFGEFAGQDKYWPLLWIFFPVVIIVGGLSFLLSLFWEGKHLVQDLKRVKAFVMQKYHLEEK